MNRYGSFNPYGNNNLSYAGNSSFNDNNSNITSTQFRALIVINCKNASLQLELEDQLLGATNGTQQYERVYKPASNGSFFNIYPGEVCFESTLLPHRNYDQQPYVRSCLNQQLVPTANKNKGISDETSMMRTVRIIGLAIKPYTWDTTVPRQSPDPVVIASGLSSLWNSSTHNISAGQILIAAFPKPGHGPQSSHEKSQYIHEHRTIFATDPLYKISDVLSSDDIHAITTLNNFAKVVNIIVSEYAAQIIGRIAVADSGSTVAGHLEQLINNLQTARNDSGIQHNSATGVDSYVEPQEVENCRKMQGRMTELMELLVPTAFDTCKPGATPAWLAHFFNELVVVSPAITSHCASRQIAIAQTSARPQKLADVISMPCVESGVTRMLTETYYTQDDNRFPTGFPVIQLHAKVPPPQNP
jgi:hypothetical protein